MSEIDIRYELKFEDYLNAQQLHAKRGLWPRFSFFLSRWFYPAFGLFFIWLAFVGWRAHTSNKTELILIFWGVFFIGSRFIQRMRYKKLYQKTRGDGGTEILFRDGNIFVERPNYAKTEYSWTAIKSWRENVSILMIYLAPAVFIPIPKRAVSERQLDDLRALLTRKVVVSS